jgi:hypothetical protein
MANVNVIDKVAASLDNLPGDLVGDAVRVFTVIAERHGGRMMGRYQLTAKPGKMYRRPDSAWVLMEGVPSGFWVWKESGTGAHEIRPKKVRRRRKGKRNFAMPGPMGGGLNHPVFGPVIHPGTTGSRKWTKTVNEADEAIGALIERALAKAVA